MITEADLQRIVRNLLDRVPLKATLDQVRDALLADNPDLSEADLDDIVGVWKASYGDARRGRRKGKL